MRRLVPGVLAIAVLAAGVWAANTRLDDQATGWETYRDEVGRWTIRHPASWDVQPFEPPPVTRSVFYAGVLLSNFDVPEDARSSDEKHPIPSHGVVVEVQVGGGPGSSGVFTCRPLPPMFPGFFGGAARAFPLEIGNAERVPTGTFDQPRLYVPFAAEGGTGGVNVYLGSDVSDQDRARAERIVSSMRPMCPAA